MPDESKPRVITLEWLKAMRACLAQQRLFARRYGDSVELTRENMEAAYGFDLGWLVHALASDEGAARRYFDEVDVAYSAYCVSEERVRASVVLRDAMVAAACEALGL